MHSKTYARVADEYLNHLNNKDVSGILSLYTPEATVEDPVGSQIVSGQTALQEFYQQIAHIDLKVERTGPVRIAGTEIAFPFKLYMTMAGKTTVTDVIDVFALTDTGEIVSMRAFHGPDNQTAVTSATD